jgi:acetylxylan esterase
MFFPTLNTLAVGLALVLPSLAAPAPLQRRTASALFQVPDFGPNPTGAGLFLYVPPNLQANPPILVNPHWCHGDANAAFVGSQFAALADQYGYIVIYPDSPNLEDKCWDVSSPETLTHNGGGDSLSIVNMVKYTITKYNANPDRVYATGSSAGAMMVNVLLGAYPDVFTGGAGLCGVAFGCFAANGVDYGSEACAEGKIIKTGAEWAAEVHAAFPSWTGTYPAMLSVQGTADTDINPQNLQEEIKQWTSLLAYPETPTSTIPNTPLPGWTKYVYGTKFEAISAGGVDHLIPQQENLVITFFGLTGTTATARNVPLTGGTIPQWDQCGGSTWKGTGSCAAGLTCTYSSIWYSQVCDIDRNVYVYKKLTVMTVPINLMQKKTRKSIMTYGRKEIYMNERTFGGFTGKGFSES